LPAAIEGVENGPRCKVIIERERSRALEICGHAKPVPNDIGSHRIE